MNAEQLAGPKEWGRHDADRELYCHAACRRGRVVVDRTAVAGGQAAAAQEAAARRRAGRTGDSGLYTTLQPDQRLADRMLELMLQGVSTRKY